MDIRWIQDFLAVAERGNFTGAATSRNISQAAFSRRIQSLEQWLGVELIDRSAFPTRLTVEGENFRDHAVLIVQQVAEARAQLTGTPVEYRDRVRIALPHALASGSLAGWWSDWTDGARHHCRVEPGNMHDSVTALVAGTVDMLICFHNDQQPVNLDRSKYDRLVLAHEVMRPYASPDLIAAGQSELPGTPSRRLPLLMYAQGTYLGRMVDCILENAGVALHGEVIVQTDMADVLCSLAVSGHGIAWLPESTARKPVADGVLVGIASQPWVLDLTILAFRDMASVRPTVERLWKKMRITAGNTIGSVSRVNNLLNRSQSRGRKPTLQWPEAT